MASNVLYYATDSTAWTAAGTTDTWAFDTDGRAGTWVLNVVSASLEVITFSVNNYDGTNLLPLTSFTVAAQSKKSIVIEGLGIPGGTSGIQVVLTKAANAGDNTLVTSGKLYRY